MKDLALRKCTPCTRFQTPLKGELLKPFEEQLYEGWAVVDEHQLERTYTFKNFKEALIFTNVIGKIAEEEGHHPTILLTWGRITLQIWTHHIDGLSESDFILASKIETEFISHQG